MSIDEELEKIKGRLREMDEVVIRVALFGQPGSGKSSLMNALLGQKVALEGQQTDKTEEQSEEYNWNGLYLVDLPGYDTTKFPKEHYFERFRIAEFDLFLCVFAGKLHQADSEFFHELHKMGKTCLFVRNKHDDLWQEDRTTKELEKDIEEDICKQLKRNVKVYFTSCRTKYGLKELSEAILGYLDCSKHEKWVTSAKAYSEEFLLKKKKACEKRIVLCAGLSAGNALNPILVLDIAVDISILLELFAKIREAFGLSPNMLNNNISKIVPAVNNIIKYATRQGVVKLLEKSAVKEALKETAKYIPLIGQIIAGSVGYAIALQAGKSYLEDCYNVAKEIMDNELAVM